MTFTLDNSGMAYKGDFTCWADVQREFDMGESEPDQVILAFYEIDGYEGSAEVLYRRGGKYYVVTGSHCSCMGLENQWEPEEYDAPTFAAMLAKRWWGTKT